MNKLCDVEKCPYCRANFIFVGGSAGLKQTGNYKCHLTKYDNKDIIPENCGRKAGE